MVKRFLPTTKNLIIQSNLKRMVLRNLFGIFLTRSIDLKKIKIDRQQILNVPQDAIGQLHRYRDAILHTEPTNSTYRAAIKNLGGIILYPYPLSEGEFTSNDYFNSIIQVNIGALPFLPSKSNLVSELLNKMINKTPPEEHFERFIEMDNCGVFEKERFMERMGNNWNGTKEKSARTT